MVVIDPLKKVQPVVEPTIGTWVKGIVPWTLDPNSAAYKQMVGMWLDDAKIQSMYWNLMKKSTITDQAKFNTATAPQKAENLASVDTKIEPTASHKTEVAQSSADTKNTATPTVIDPNKDDSDVRQAQILANLKNFEATTPEIFNNKAEYDKVVGRANKSVLQQKIVDNYFNSVKATKEKIASVDKAKVELASMSDSALGYLKPSTEQLSVINGDPELLARYTQATINRNILDSIQKSLQPVDTSAVLDWLDNIAGNYPQEVAAAKVAYNTENEKLTALKTNLDNVETKVRNEMDGKGYSEAAILAKINKEKSMLTNDYNLQVGVLNGKVATLTALKEDADLRTAETKAKQDDITSKIAAYNSFFGDITQRNGAGKFTTTADPMGRWYIVTNNQTGTTELKTYEQLVSDNSTSTDTNTQYSPITYNKSDMRTDRHSNPTAMTTDVAKQWWLVEWVDYEKWDAFPNNPNIFTAKLLWNYVDNTIKVIDNIWFKTKSGKSRRTYTDSLWLTNESWSKMSYSEKVAAVQKMYKQEGGSKLFQWWTPSQSSQKFDVNPLLKTAFDNAKKSGKTLDYKELVNLSLTTWLSEQSVKNEYMKYNLNVQNNDPQFTDYETAKKSLSKNAQAYLNGGGKWLPWTIIAQVKDEINNSGIMDFWMGNYIYTEQIKSVPKEYKGMVAMAKTIVDLEALKLLSESVDTWPIAWARYNVSKAAWASKATNILSTIAWQNLAAYIKDISGAAVSEQEAQRLSELVPNFKQNDSQFDTNVQLALEKARQYFEWHAREFWFSSTDAFMKELWITNTNWQDMLTSIYWMNWNEKDWYTFADEVLNNKKADIATKDY